MGRTGRNRAKRKAKGKARVKADRNYGMARWLRKRAKNRRQGRYPT